MKENNKSKMPCLFFISLGKESDCAHSEPISAICRRSIMENKLADGLIIFLIVPYSVSNIKENNKFKID